jgi:polar amino acid transport system substrate-binding protein
MKKVLLLCAVALGLAVLAAGCGGGDESASAPDTQAPATTAAETEAPADTGAAGTGVAETVAEECAAESLNLVNPGQLTVATGNPAYPPWFEGGETGNEWKINDPANGKGFESAVAYAVAEQLGFAPDQVVWVPTTFNEAIAPGPKKWDFNIQQIGITKKRAKSVQFSDGYYDNVQALVTVEGSPVEGATTVAELKDAKLGVPLGTTSYDFVVDQIQPSQEPAVYDDQNGAVQALKNGQIDGIVVDLYSAFYMRDVQLSDAKGIIVGQFPPLGDTEQFGVTFEQGNPLVACVNQAIEAAKLDGTLDAIFQEWLATKGSAPVITE